MDSFLKKLRNRKTGTAPFREFSHKISLRLSASLAALLRKRRISLNNVVLVVILRSGIALLPSALHFFPKAPVGVLGFKRDENTFEPRWYYENLPMISKRSVIVLLDPMLATGGSAEAAVLRLLRYGAKLENIYFLGLIGAQEGQTRLARFIPRQNILLSAVDKELNAKKYIVPGLGDFGDRYFGHNGQASLGH